MNQYREGKVKRTLNKGVKKILKPYAYKRSEPVRGDGVPFAYLAYELLLLARLSTSGADP